MAPSEEERVGLFLQALAQAWRRYALYPDGHPARQGVVDHATAQLHRLASEGDLAVGVARDGFVAGDVTVDAPGVAALAALLYRSNVGVLRFSKALAPDGMERLLATFGRESSAGVERPTAIGAGAATASDDPASGIVNLEIDGLSVELVDYSAVSFTEEGRDPGEISLWDRILRLRIGGRVVRSDDEPSLALVLHWLRETLPGLSIGGQPATGGETPSAVEIQRVAGAVAETLELHLRQNEETGGDRVREAGELLAALPPPLLQPVVESVLDSFTRPGEETGPLDALGSQASASDVYRAFRALRDRGRPFSEAGIRLLERVLSELPDGDGATLDPSALRALEQDPDGQPPALFDAFRFDLPTANAASATAPSLEDDRRLLAPASLSQALLGSLLRLLATESDRGRAEAILGRLGRAVRELVVEGRAPAAAALVQQLRRGQASGRLAPPVAAAIGPALDAIGGVETAESLLESLRTGEASDRTKLQHFVETLGGGLYESLLLVLAETEERRDRRLLYDFVRDLGQRIAEPARALLRAPQWFVVRNMVSLLDQIDDREALPLIRSALLHDEPRVRVEAARFVCRVDRSPSPQAIQRMLDDPDPAAAERMVELLGAHRVAAAVAPLAALLQGRDPLGRRRAQRVRALAALGRIGDPAALPRVEPFLTLGISTHSAAERLAAWESLGGYPQTSVAAHVERGAGSRDGSVRAICERLRSASA